MCAKKSDIKQVNQAARQAGLTYEQRREFGDYIEEMKKYTGIPGNENYSFKKLLEIAEEFKK